MKFSEFDLIEGLQKSIEAAGYETCMPVQEATLQKTLNNRDVLVQSQTGSGKTAAFIISIFQLLSVREDFKDKKALVIVPTRELAAQIEDEAAILNKFLNFKLASFYGGVGYKKQEQQLLDGVNLIISTPGRLLDLYKMKKFNFKDVGIFVIDEADRLFDMGFMQDLRKMFQCLPDKELRQTMLFSATLNMRVKNLAWQFLNDPLEVDIEPEQVTVEKIKQSLYHVGRDEKVKLLLGLLKKYNPKNVIIFANTKNMVYELSKRLEQNGFSCQYIMGDLPQKQRLEIIDNIKNNKIKILVATDVAARGLHVDDLDLVINYDLPDDSENYVHRIGRTARAGKTGEAIALACEKYVYNLEAIEKYINMKIPVEWFEDEMLVEDLSAGMRFVYKDLDKEREHKRDQNKGKRTKTGEHEHKKKPAHTEHKPKKDETSKETKVKKEYTGKKEQTHSTAKKSNHKPTNKNRNHKKDLDSRLAYYKEKYGEDFKATPELKKAEKRHKIKSVINKIKSIIKPTKKQKKK